MLRKSGVAVAALHRLVAVHAAELGDAAGLDRHLEHLRRRAEDRRPRPRQRLVGVQAAAADVGDRLEGDADRLLVDRLVDGAHLLGGKISIRRRACGRSDPLRLASGQPPERLHVALARARDDLGGELRRRRFVVPARGVEPVAHELLVERDRLARRASRPRPPSSATSRASATSSISVSSPSIQPNSNLVSASISPRSAACRAPARVEREGQVAQPARRSRRRRSLATRSKVDVLVVARLGLGRRGEDRLGQRGSRARARPGAACRRPRRRRGTPVTAAGEVAARHAFERHHARLAAPARRGRRAARGARAQLGGEVGARRSRAGGWAPGPRSSVEPEVGELGQDLPLAGDRAAAARGRRRRGGRWRRSGGGRRGRRRRAPCRAAAAARPGRSVFQTAASVPIPISDAPIRVMRRSRWREIRARSSRSGSGCAARAACGRSRAEASTIS